MKEGFAKGELDNDFEWGGDFGAPDETYISKQFDAPVFVHHFCCYQSLYFERIRSVPNVRSVQICLRRKVTAKLSAAAKERWI